MKHYHWLHLAGLLWIIFLAYWFVSAQKLKSIKQREPRKERFLTQEFGDKFREQARRTGMFLPRFT